MVQAQTDSSTGTDGPPLRHEVDAVRWYMERKALKNALASVPQPVPALRWTALGPPSDIADAIPEIAEAVERELVRWGIRVQRWVAGSTRVGTDGWTDRKLDETLAWFREDDPQGMPGMFALWVARDHAPEDRPSWAVAAIKLDIDVNFVDKTIWHGLVTAAHGLFEGRELDAFCEALECAMRRIALLTNVVWAAVTCDQVEPDVTPYERYHSVRAGFKVLDADRRPRGYYWSNLLSAEHVAGLGGLGNIMAGELGLYLDVLRDEPGRELAVVRAPGPISQFTDEQLADVKETLGPILPKYTYRWYAGPPLRVLKEPGDAFPSQRACEGRATCGA